MSEERAAAFWRRTIEVGRLHRQAAARMTERHNPEPEPPPSLSSRAEAMSGLFNRDTMPAIMPDLLPVTSWGSNLAKLLIWRSWKAIRAPVMARRGYRCQICGGGSGQRLECHEIWAYSLPPQGAPEEVVGVQRLMGLATLCPSCHEMFHLGFARVQGRATEAKARLMAVNRWSNSEFDAYHAAMGHRYESRCRWRWVLDLSLVQWAAPLAVDTNKGWVLGEDGSLFRTDPHTRLTAWTAILGVPFSVAGRDMPAISPAEGYDGLHPEQGDFGFVRSMGNGVANAAPEAMDEDDGEEPAAAATFRVVDAAHAAPEAVDENEDLAAAVTFRVVEVAEAEQAGRRVAGADGPAVQRIRGLQRNAGAARAARRGVRNSAAGSTSCWADGGKSAPARGLRLRSDPSCLGEAWSCRRGQDRPHRARSHKAAGRDHRIIRPVCARQGRLVRQGGGHAGGGERDQAGTGAIPHPSPRIVPRRCGYGAARD